MRQSNGCSNPRRTAGYRLPFGSRSNWYSRSQRIRPPNGRADLRRAHDAGELDRRVVVRGGVVGRDGEPAARVRACRAGQERAGRDGHRGRVRAQPLPPVTNGAIQSGKPLSFEIMHSGTRRPLVFALLGAILGQAVGAQSESGLVSRLQLAATEGYASGRLTPVGRTNGGGIAFWFGEHWGLSWSADYGVGDYQ